MIGAITTLARITEKMGDIIQLLKLAAIEHRNHIHQIDMTMVITILVVIITLLLINFALVEQTGCRQAMIHGPEQNHRQIKLRTIPTDQSWMALVKDREKFL